MHVVRRHWFFAALLVLGAGLRALAVLGYRPALWFWADSFAYLSSALDLTPLKSRPSGYSLFLKPFGSIEAVVIVQHLLGIGIAACVYLVLLRRTRLPPWSAALVTAPVLFDVHQIQLEHLIMADLLFTALVAAAVTVLLWRPQPTWPFATAALGLLGLATLTRTLGLALLVTAAGWLLIMRSWRAAAAGAATCALVLAGYATWFHTDYGSYGLGGNSAWLWSRTMTFADCGRMDPPSTLEILCPSGQRLAAPAYIWDSASPLVRAGSRGEALAGQFASLAIRRQPIDFLLTGLKDALWAFEWDRVVYPRPGTQSAYVFPARIPPFTGEIASAGRTAGQLTTQYQGSSADTRVAQPYARWLRAYQSVGYLRGPFLAVILLIGLYGLARRRWTVLVPWAFATTLLFLPPLIAAFDHRYVVPVVPLACLAAGLALDPVRRSRGAHAKPHHDRRAARVGTDVHGPAQA
ncbi:hypothetical protein J5X84_00240 [Streptosporangiaceae bacterium NEAU-GS5]|nr:hypothetical protein [Streptosporangiaceae bacterium NEAU-GS5]